MAKEEWQRTIVENVLERPVEIHDDNSKDGMYDLRIGDVDNPDIAIECVRAVEQAYMETLNQRSLLHTSVLGIWWMEITTKTRINGKARIKVLEKEIDSLLQELQSNNLTSVTADWWLEYKNEGLSKRLKALGIKSIHYSRPSDIGQVYLLMPGKWFSENNNGDALPGWVEQFLISDACQDVRIKLQRSGAVERQVFIVTGFHGLPEAVDAYLRGELNQVPSSAPDLPSPVTGVWIIEEASKRGLRWDGGEWHFFDVS